MRAHRSRPCPIPRGDSRLFAIALLRAAQHRGLNTDTLKAAVLTACLVHGQQQRSADGQPYVMHPLQVALLVCRWHAPEDDMLAAVLHDTAEDADVGPAEMLGALADLFGTGVAQRVSALTKNRLISCSEARSGDHVARLLEAAEDLGPGVLAIRLAGRLHNCITSAHFDAARLQRLQAHTLQHVVPLARRLQLPAVADFLSSPPSTWHSVPVLHFVPEMLRVQPAWFGDPVPMGRRPDEANAVALQC